jgi:hypothetical protein
VAVTEAGHELNAEIAEKIFGFPITWIEKDERLGFFPYGYVTNKERRAAIADRITPPDMEHCRPGSGHEHCGTAYRTVWQSGYVKSYSTDIAAAWEVLDKLGPEWWPEVGRMLGGKEWYCEICRGGPTPADVGPPFRVVAPTAPLAICLAALKAVG